MTLKRTVCEITIKDVIKQCAKRPMIYPTVTHDKESIEEYFGEAKIDFANKFIGGGSLGAGCVQEEIMFANHP